MNHDSLPHDPRIPRSSLFVATILAGLFAAAWIISHRAVPGVELSYAQMVEALKDGRVTEDAQHPLDLQIEEGSSTQTLMGYYSTNPLSHGHSDGFQPFHTTFSLDHDQDLVTQLKSTGLAPKVRNRSHAWSATMFNFLPLVIFAVMLGLIFGGIYLAASLIVRRLCVASPP